MAERNDNNTRINTGRKKKRKKEKIIGLLLKSSAILNILLVLIIVVLSVYIKNSASSDTVEENNKEEVEKVVSESYIVCIDPGHGESDVGAEGTDGSYEKDDVLELALLVQKELENKGIKVIMTRTTDIPVVNADRAKIANEAKADIMVSIHRNDYQEDSSVCGVEAWIHSKGSESDKAAAEAILSALENKTTITKNRGVKTGTQSNSESNYLINSKSQMTSMILEMGFMSNQKDLEYFKTYTEEYALAISDGIISWLDTYSP